MSVVMVPRRVFDTLREEDVVERFEVYSSPSYLAKMRGFDGFYMVLLSFRDYEEVLEVKYGSIGFGGRDIVEISQRWFRRGVWGAGCGDGLRYGLRGAMNSFGGVDLIGLSGEVVKAVLALACLYAKDGEFGQERWENEPREVLK